MKLQKVNIIGDKYVHVFGKKLYFIRYRNLLSEEKVLEPITKGEATEYLRDDSLIPSMVGYEAEAIVEEILNNTKVEIETTKEDYEQLSGPNPKNPEYNGDLDWLHSLTRKKFNTASGDLEDGQYADYNLRMVKVAGYVENSLEADKVLAGDVDQAIIDKNIALPHRAQKFTIVREGKEKLKNK
jgi:hypothetical protein